MRDLPEHTYFTILDEELSTKTIKAVVNNFQFIMTPVFTNRQEAELFVRMLVVKKDEAVAVAPIHIDLITKK